MSQVSRFIVILCVRTTNRTTERVWQHSAVCPKTDSDIRLSSWRADMCVTTSCGVFSMLTGNVQSACEKAKPTCSVVPSSVVWLLGCALCCRLPRPIPAIHKMAVSIINMKYECLRMILIMLQSYMFYRRRAKVG